MAISQHKTTQNTHSRNASTAPKRLGDLNQGKTIFWIYTHPRCASHSVNETETRTHFGCFSSKHTTQTDDNLLVVSLMICFSKSRPVTSTPYARSPCTFIRHMKISNTQTNTRLSCTHNGGDDRQPNTNAHYIYIFPDTTPNLPIKRPRVLIARWRLLPKQTREQPLDSRCWSFPRMNCVHTTCAVCELWCLPSGVGI